MDQEKISYDQIRFFQSMIYDFYHTEGRSFAWRFETDPYKIFISEVMLQQTQTTRVCEKYEQFIETFPTIFDVAEATLLEVLQLWQGLGYNRRGKYLHEAAKIIVEKYDGAIPNDPEKLILLPGIGKATAASICAFAFNRPTIFIETNIRSVFINHFFKNKDAVLDAEIMPLIEQTLDTSNPRTWYYALMDYGVFLKKQRANPSRKSAHHTKQSRFKGSDREIRGAIVRLLTQKGSIKKNELLTILESETSRLNRIIDQLCKEKLISENNDYLSI